MNFELLLYLSLSLRTFFFFGSLIFLFLKVVLLFYTSVLECDCLMKLSYGERNVFMCVCVNLAYIRVNMYIYSWMYMQFLHMYVYVWAGFVKFVSLWFWNLEYVLSLFFEL